MISFWEDFVLMKKFLSILCDKWRSRRICKKITTKLQGLQCSLEKSQRTLQKFEFAVPYIGVRININLGAAQSSPGISPSILLKTAFFTHWITAIMGSNMYTVGQKLHCIIFCNNYVKRFDIKTRKGDSCQALQLETVRRCASRSGLQLRGP